MEHSKERRNKVPSKDCGTVLTGKAKKKVTTSFQPCSNSSYSRDNKFETIFGFIVMDGNGVLFGTLRDETRKVLHKFNVDIPKKQGKGSEDAQRLARLKIEIRQEYIRNVAKIATELFITNDKPNVTGLILAGSAGSKKELSQSRLFDTRLKNNVIKLVDVSSGGDSGFLQAIELVAGSLKNIKSDQEKNLLDLFFDEIHQDAGKYCFGVEDTLRGLEMGAVETLICSEKLDIRRYILKNITTGGKTISYLTSDQQLDRSHFTDKESGAELKVVKCQLLLEWLANNYNNFGATFKLITGNCQGSSDFFQGYGGIGGLLRYKVDFQSFQLDNAEGSA